MEMMPGKHMHTTIPGILTQELLKRCEPGKQYPSDRNHSVMINNYADPQLVSEALQAQSANVDIVTGATDSSDAFIQSLTDALSQAHV